MLTFIVASYYYYNRFTGLCFLVPNGKNELQIQILQVKIRNVELK